MADLTPRNPESTPDPDSDYPLPSRRRGFVAGLALGLIGAGVVGYAIGLTTPSAIASFGRAFAHDGGPPDPAQVREHAEFFVAFALNRLDATVDQEAQVQKILGGAIDELFPIVLEHRANRDELRTILGGATIDRAAIEKLRVEEVALADDLSKVVASAVADSAEALSLEQRTELMERLARFRHHH